MIMRDVQSGWAVRYTHANVASFFFIFVYAHIARGLYYGSYRSPRVLLWSIGVIILIVMMAYVHGPNYFDGLNILINWVLEIKFYLNSFFYLLINNYDYLLCSMLPINKARTKALDRVGPHNKNILDLIICGMLGDFWGDKIPGKNMNSVRFNIEQGIVNSAYIHYLTMEFYNLGYCPRPVPTLITKYHKLTDNSFNYKLNLFTFTSLYWIYEAFYVAENGTTKKVVPLFISEFLSPLGLAH